jgi:hypothetical protein
MRRVILSREEPNTEMGWGSEISASFNAVQPSLGALTLAQQAPASIAPVDSPDLEQFVRGPASLFQIMHIQAWIYLQWLCLACLPTCWLYDEDALLKENGKER